MNSANHEAFIHDILPPQEVVEAMARKRYQHPQVFQTRAKEKSARRWYFRPRIDVLVGAGELDRVEKRVYLGDVSAMGKRDAEKARDEYLVTLNKPAQVLQSQVVFGDVLDRYLEMADLKPESLIQYRARINAHVKPKWGEARLCDITPMEFERWMLTVARQNSEQTTSGIRSVFTAAWKAAIRWGMTQTVCPADCCPKLRNFGVKPRVMTIPTVEQFHLFLSAIDQRMRPIILIGAFTGLRVGEILALRWRQFDADVLLVSESIEQHSRRGGTPKSNKPREVPIGHIRHMFTRPAGVNPESRVFPMGYGSVHNQIRKAAETVGIYHPGFGAHTFRRAFTTWFRRSNSDSREVVELAMKTVGHVNQKTNDLYRIEEDADMVRRAQLMSGLMGDVMGKVQ